MTAPPRVAKLLRGVVAVGVSAGLAFTAATVPAAAEPAKGPATVKAPSAAVAPGVTVRIDPSYQHPEFEGWGTSLVWMANKTGGYPEPIRRKLVDMLFGEDGLRLNIARYNIGGGNAPTVRSYLRPGGAVPGFWKADKQYGPTDKEWWNPDNPDHWNWDADANQRWWIDQIKGKVDRWEAFSNSPPWFQTVSGYVSGGFNATDDQIRADKVDDFATYLVRVTEHIEKAHGIRFETIAPLNEPNTDYWKTVLEPDGQPRVGRYQEGAHAGPALQAKVLLALQKRLATARTRATVSAMDETNPGRFLQNWQNYPAEARAAATRLNVHTYGTGQRTAVRDVAKAEQRKLWMSEVEGSWGNDFTSMNSGLGMANLIVNDIRELEPSAWVLWQPIEDIANMVAEGNLQWGNIHIRFDCTAEDTLETCAPKTNTKFDTIRNFTHYIRPGDRFVKNNDPSSAAAIRKGGKGAVVVHVNSGTEPRPVTLDLSGFAKVDGTATVTPVTTTVVGEGDRAVRKPLVRGTPVKVRNRTATLTVPAQSVTTFLVDGVSGVNADAALIQTGHPYRLQGVQSGRSLAPDADGSAAVIRTDNPARADQLWYLRKVRHGVGNRDRYVVVNASTGRRLAVRGDATVLENGTQTADEAAQWIMSTTGNGTYTFVNVAAKKVLEVGGEARDDGKPVSAWFPNSGANQRWTVLDETVLRTQTVELGTVPGLAPKLPATVTAVHRSGVRRDLPVRWETVSRSKWRTPGRVTVKGTSTDALGRAVKAKAVVTVDTFVAAEPGRAKTYVGGQPELPSTVVGLGRHGGRATLPVTWKPARAGAYDRLGVVTVAGTATVFDGSTLTVTARVQVSAHTEANAAVEPGVRVDATFTENNYSTEPLRNGVTSGEKAWSNWRSGTQNPSETITLKLPRPVHVTRVVVHTYRDGGGGLPKSLRIQTRRPDGSCADASGDVPVGAEGAPVVPVTVSAGPTNEVCVVLTPQPGGWMTLSEIEVFVKAPGVSADAGLSAIQVNGAPIPGFRPDVTKYRVLAARPERAVVTATAADPYAAVRVERGKANRWAITVTGEDGSQTRKYEVTVFGPRWRWL